MTKYQASRSTIQERKTSLLGIVSTVLIGWSTVSQAEASGRPEGLRWEQGRPSWPEGNVSSSKTGETDDAEFQLGPGLTGCG